jgi:hypothetical protein
LGIQCDLSKVDVNILFKFKFNDAKKTQAM